MGAEEALTERNTVTSVAGWNITGFLLPGMGIALFPSKLRRLLHFGIAIL